MASRVFGLKEGLGKLGLGREHKKKRVGGIRKNAQREKMEGGPFEPGVAQPPKAK